MRPQSPLFIVAVFAVMLLLSALSSLTSFAALTQPTDFMLKDINTATANSYPYHYVEFKGALYFSALDKVNGGSLWKTDGTQEGTVLVKTIAPDVENYVDISNIRTTQDWLFLTGYPVPDYDNGPFLFQSDGTTAGTIQMSGIFTSVYMMNATDNLLFFHANDPEYGREIWRTDGTAAGTFRLTDIMPGPAETSVQLTEVVDNQFFFVTRNLDSKVVLWRTDGTVNGTTQIRELFSDATSYQTYIADMQEFGGTLYYLLYYGAENSGRVELWKSDGSETGTTLVKQIDLALDGNGYPISTTVYLHRFNESKFMILFKDNGQLWSSDGSEAGTTLVRDLDLELGYQSATDGTTFYFIGESAESGAEIWKSNGTTAGTVQVADVNPGSEPALEIEGYNDFTMLNGQLFFSADDGTHGTEPWLTDGSAANTRLLLDINPYAPFSGNGFNPYSPFVFKDTLFFAAYHPQYGMELWRSDGTSAGTKLLKDINYIETGDACPAGFAQTANKTIFFAAQQGPTGMELWKSDGTSGGTQMVKEHVPGSIAGIYKTFAAAGNHYYYSSLRTADPDIYEPKFWASDGTQSGTMRIDFTPPSTGLSSMRDYASFGDSFYMFHQSPIQNNGTIPSEPSYTFLRIQGTSVTTLTTFNGYYYQIDLPDMKPAGKLLYFFTNGATWRTDGTVAGTQQVTTALYKDFATLGSHTFFITSDALWQTDGSEVGTTVVKTINGVESLAATDSSLFIMGSDGLWKSDGTAAGSMLISGKTGTGLVRAGSNVYFIVRPPNLTDTFELWGSDGTSPGTRKLQSITATQLYAFTAHQGQLFFVAEQFSPRNKWLWKSDGTVAGTKQVADLKKKIQDDTDDCPAQIYSAGERLYYTANDGLRGIELWVYGENLPVATPTTATPTATATATVTPIPVSTPVEAYKQYLPVVVR